MEKPGKKPNSTVTFPRFPRTRDLFLMPGCMQCSCAVQRGQLLLLRSLRRFEVGPLAFRTCWLHLHPQIEELERLANATLWCITVNFGPNQKRQNVRPQRMFLKYKTGNIRACAARIKTKNSRSRCEYHCKQTVLYSTAKTAHAEKMCLSTCDRPALQSH